MSSKTVEYRLATANLPPLTAQQKAELAALAALPDGQIDTSDIAPLPDEFWIAAVRTQTLLRNAMLQEQPGTTTPGA